jgi:lantibiotic modifying enzyme
VSKDLAHVKELVASMQVVLTSSADDFPYELLDGRAGALYLLRAVRHWVPNSAPLVERGIVALTEQIMQRAGQWEFHGGRYLGAVHGDVAILTQLVLTTPPIAPQLAPHLRTLLQSQREDGSWPAKEGHDGRLVQFCHGSPGMVLSLLSLRPYFPEMEAEVDEAIRKGRENTWREGLLKKEPSICHGVFGNGM